jgi:fermentation-respiration switch protein FrsA (DUF1100 family)
VWTRIPVFAGDKLVNIGKVAKLRLPVLVIHGTADRTVPFSHGRALFEAITARKERFFVQDGPHTGLADFVGPAYWSAMKQFTDSLDRPVTQ